MKVSAVFISLLFFICAVSGFFNVDDWLDDEHEVTFSDVEKFLTGFGLTNFELPHWIQKFSLSVQNLNCDSSEIFSDELEVVGEIFERSFRVAVPLKYRAVLAHHCLSNKLRDLKEVLEGKSLSNFMTVGVNAKLINKKTNTVLTEVNIVANP